MMGELRLLQELPADSSRPSVQFHTSLDGNFLKVDFRIANAKLNAKATYPKDRPVWGLWDSDVCELFISSAQSEDAIVGARYFEFQVSPFAQYFELEILEPRVKWNEEFRSGVEYSAAVRTTQAWSCSLKLDLQKLGLDPTKPVYGNLCSCLLREPHRAYMALNHAENQKPDYHRYENFKKIL